MPFLSLAAIGGLFKSPITWAVIAAMIAAGAIFVSFSKGEHAGAADVTAKVQARTIEVQRSITDAENRGPRTQRDVSRRLRDHTF